MGTMIYDTKTALILRTDLAGWQVANVAAFLTGGLMAGNPEMAGEPYRDAAGRAYTALIREPMFVYGATLEELQRTHQLARQGALVGSLQFLQRGAVDAHRFTDERRVGPATGIAVGFAHQVRMGAGEATGQEGGDIGHLPGGQVLAQNEGSLGFVDHAAHMGHAAPIVLNIRA